MSSYELTDDEKIALSFGLDHHIPTNINHVAIQSEFEQFYQGLVKNLSNIPADDLTRIKTKLLSTCEQYSNVKVPYKYRKTVNNLKNNPNIVLLKQDKGRGVVVLDKTKYTEKCLSLLNSPQFTTLQSDPTTKIERKVQNALRKLNPVFLKKNVSNFIQQGQNQEISMEQQKSTNLKKVTQSISFLLDLSY